MEKEKNQIEKKTFENQKQNGARKMVSIIVHFLHYCLSDVIGMLSGYVELALLS